MVADFFVCYCKFERGDGEALGPQGEAPAYYAHCVYPSATVLALVSVAREN
jgi:hypothetical protein